MTVPVFPTLYPKFPDREVIGSFTLQETISGLRTSLVLQSYPRYRYTIDFEVLRSYGSLTEWQQLEGFYKTMITSPGVFSYNDVDDGSVAAQVFATGDGTTASFQLIRTLGGFSEPVFCVTGSPSVFDNGTPVAGGNFSIDSYGVVTFITPPVAGHTLTWTGNYNWYCRFDNESQNFTKIGTGFRQLTGLSFSTEKF